MPYFVGVKVFKWNAEKNAELELQRGITFEEIVEMIGAGASVWEVDHPNREKYPNQQIMIVDVNGYAYMVPFVKNEQVYFLKTIIPSRKATKRFLRGERDERQ